ncbi:thioesterase domain-containing protein, partial [Methylocucumis oryzae]
YLGRLDNQVKLRGFRIELGEIESVLLKQPGINEAVALLKSVNTVTQLCAYIAGDIDQLNAETLRAALSQQLPDYAVPSAFVILPTLPKLASGKLNKQALPEPEQRLKTHTAPSTELEIQLVTIWQDVLGVADIGIDDNFFGLGGHSLLAMRLVSECQRRLNIVLPLAQLLAHPNIAELAASLNSHAKPSLIVPLNAHKSFATPLFCFHPAGGHVFAYQTLARELATQRPVYGLAYTHLNPAISLTTLADDYAVAINLQQPQGHLCLLGWSLGGALALLTAKALEHMGRTVRFIALIDSFVPGFDDDNVEQTSELIHAFAKEISGADCLPEFTDAEQLAAWLQTNHPTWVMC